MQCQNVVPLASVTMTLVTSSVTLKCWPAIVTFMMLLINSHVVKTADAITELAYVMCPQTALLTYEISLVFKLV